MVHAISGSSVQANAPVARAQPIQSEPSAQKPAQTKTPDTTVQHGDTVRISAAAQQASQAMKESTETPSQTTQEASRGDRQAQRLLAKEAQDKTP